MGDRRPRQRAVNFAANQAAKLAAHAAAAKVQRAYRQNQARRFKPYGASYPTQVGRYRARHKKYYKPRKQSLKKKVRALESKVNQDLATHTYKKAITSRAVQTSDSVVSYTQLKGMDMTELESHLGALRFYDPGTNALVTNSIVTGTYSRNLYIQNMYTKMVFRNNYRVPCTIDVYVCIPKKDTSIGPNTAMNNGFTDQNNPDQTSTLLYPSDSDQFKDLWTIAKHKKRILEPGKQFSVTHSCGRFHYDPADYDTHNMTYQKRYGSHVYLIRLQGVLAHDQADTGQQGLAPCGVDYSQERITKIRYDAGKKLNDITLSDGHDAFTTAEQVGIKVNAENNQFSLT